MCCMEIKSYGEYFLIVNNQLRKSDNFLTMKEIVPGQVGTDFDNRVNYIDFNAKIVNPKLKINLKVH